MLAFALHPIFAASAYETLHQFVSAYEIGGRGPYGMVIVSQRGSSPRDHVAR
jgi:hypothetical protein